jgi:hypothetical protein
MPDNHNHSEVARLLAQIEAEHRAAEQALHAPFYAAKHAFITARMQCIGECGEQLKALVGTEQSLELVYRTLESCPVSDTSNKTP